MSVQALSCAMVLRGVSASEKLLLLVLANYADENMSCWPSHKRLSEDTCLSQRTVLTLLKGLEERRIVARRERFRKDGSRTSDVITLYFSGEVISPPPENGNTPPTQLAAGGGEVVSPLTTFEPSPNHQKNPTTSGASAPEWQAMFDQAKEAAGDMADFTRPAMHHVADLRALIEPASGEPCTWDEVLTAVAMTAMRQRAKRRPITSWTWVRDDAFALRDKRLNAVNPDVAPAIPLRPGGESFVERDAAIRAEARRRVLES